MSSSILVHHPALDPELDNVRVWNGFARGHYEVWYLTFNHLASRTGFWLRYTMEAPHETHGEPYAQLWFAAFFADAPHKNFARHQRFPIDAMRSSAAPFELRVGDALLTHHGASGSITGEGHSASWNLEWRPTGPTKLHLPHNIYTTGFADTRVLSPNWRVRARGAVTLDGTELAFDDAPLGQTHLWGRKHAHSWAWGHCNAFPNAPDAALETLSIRLKKGGVVLPPLTLVSLALDGETHELNRLKDTAFSRGRYGTAHYEFSARREHVRVRGEFSCRPSDMVLAEYSDPDGEPSFCANTEVANLRVNVWRRSGWWSRWLHDVELVAPVSGHFEVAQRTPDPAISNWHLEA